MAVVSKEPPSHSVYQRMDGILIRLGRIQLSSFVPGLEDLSEEQLDSEPGYRVFLRSAGLAPLYYLAGIFFLLFFDGHWTGYAVMSVGLALQVSSIFGLRLVMQARQRASSQADTARAGDPTFRDVERIRSERAGLEERLFQRNLMDEFALKAFEWRDIQFFEDGGYRFAPRTNVLLGKNGYGKTLLFRSLTAMLQRDSDYSALLLAKIDKSSAGSGSGPGGRLRVEVTRNGNTEEIARDATYFEDSRAPVGKIPMLAIPDSRFLNRTRRTVSGAASTSEELASSGARNYLTQEPYENIVQDLLTQLCLDYLEPVGLTGARGFDRQIFRLVEDVVGELTDDREFRFEEIKRVGTGGFEILVRSGGTQNVAIPIQSASQGTLSIVAIFGLIYSFLHSRWPELSEDRISTGAAIVLIDEIDAHLHPSWQQKLLGMLTRRFPNVQFIVSAHSPAIVAGCDKGEVSVLRRRPGKGKFYVDTLPEDFLGANAQDLYKRVFEIEDVDRLYLEFTAKGSSGREEREREIERLQKKKRRSAQEEESLNQLLRETRLVGRAEEAREQRLKSARDETQLAMLDDEVERLRYGLKKRDDEIEKLTSTLKEREGEIERLKLSSGKPAGEANDATRLP